MSRMISRDWKAKTEDQRFKDGSKRTISRFVPEKIWIQCVWNDMVCQSDTRPQKADFCFYAPLSLGLMSLGMIWRKRFIESLIDCRTEHLFNDRLTQTEVTIHNVDIPIDGGRFGNGTPNRQRCIQISPRVRIRRVGKRVRDWYGIENPWDGRKKASTNQDIETHPPFLVAKRNSIRGFVHPSVGRSVRHAFLKNRELNKIQRNSS